MSEDKKDSSFIPKPSSLIPRIKRALRGEVDARTVALEALRRSRMARSRRRERARLELLDKTPARLVSFFARERPTEMLDHFRRRAAPAFLPGLSLQADSTASLERELFPSETEKLLKDAERILSRHSWPILGFGEKSFGEEINWRRDPLSGYEWPLSFHADITFSRQDGSDVRVLWELNRFNHLLTLGRAYKLTGDERYSLEFFRQLEGWRRQNPVGRGANWACAMEVALRAMNLLAAFELFRESVELTEERLLMLLTTFDQHGAHIRRNLEFSYIATSNHYLSDVVGLLWIGIMLPELEAARGWREFALRQMLREMDKQVLADGADFEASTGYHRLVLELFLYSFLLCRENNIEIEERYWLKLKKMMEYLRATLRPDGRAPLVGDTDSGRVLPVKPREADDHAFLLALGAALFNEPRFKITGRAPLELLWILGRDGVRAFESLPQSSVEETSRGFADAGTYILRERDLYLHFNAGGIGARGRGSHGHNDALSLEVSACGVSFIADPGTYVYTADPEERHRFRSVRYHSTVEVDATEQNTTNPATPFVMGDEARPRVMRWETGPDTDVIVAEHRGYTRLPLPVHCVRAVRFDKRKRYWLVEDGLTGSGEHDFRFRFHFTSGLEIEVREQGVVALDKGTGARLVVAPLSLDVAPELEQLFTSRDYGAKRPSLAACWRVRADAPLAAAWAIVPVCPHESEAEKLDLIAALRRDAQSKISL
jgi:hypothetical protein